MLNLSNQILISLSKDKTDYKGFYTNNQTCVLLGLDAIKPPIIQPNPKMGLKCVRLFTQPNIFFGTKKFFEHNKTCVKIVCQVQNLFLV